MELRNHKPIVIEEFNGLWQRGDPEAAPLDHFTDCENVSFFTGGFKTRDGINPYRGIGNVLRLYNFVMESGESLLALVEGGDIYHSIDEDTTYGPILSIPEMTDFGFASYGGRAYITPFTSELNSQGMSIERGLEDEFVYVYKGDGTTARKAAGAAPTNGSDKAFLAFNSKQIGVVGQGVHVIAVAIDGGPLGPEVYQVVLAPGDKQIQLANIPVGGSSRTIVMTRSINPKDYVADQTSYTYYTALTIADGTTTDALISIADASLTSVYAPGAGTAPVTNALLVQNTETPGYTDFGFHIIAVVYETDTGYLTAPGPEYFAGITTVNIKTAITISNIPVSPDSFVTKRRLVATRAIPQYNGDQVGFQFFFIPDGDIDDNTTTTKTVSFYDSDLLEDASHLLDNFDEIPAQVGLTLYHNRLVGYTSFEDISLLRVSAVGEPEAISEVDGLLIVPPDGNPLTNAQEFRDVLYAFKKTRTIGFADNGDVPSSWPMVVIDQGIGASVHGVGTVLDSGGVNIDFLLIVDFSGLMLFNGAYARPELSYKIKDFWFDLDRNDFKNIQIMNDSLTQVIYITLPDKKMLIADYDDGLNAKDIKWSKWRFAIETTTITLVETNILIIGARDLLAE